MSIMNSIDNTDEEWIHNWEYYYEY